MFIYVWKSIVSMDEYYYEHEMLDGEMGLNSNWPSPFFISWLWMSYVQSLEGFFFFNVVFLTMMSYAFNCVLKQTNKN